MSIVPYGRDLRGAAGGRSDQCSANDRLNKYVLKRNLSQLQMKKLRSTIKFDRNLKISA